MSYRPADHAMGLELQIEELAEESRRASTQGRPDDAERLDGEIGVLQSELAETAERLAKEGPGPTVAPRMHNADELSVPDGP